MKYRKNLLMKVLLITGLLFSTAYAGIISSAIAVEQKEEKPKVERAEVPPYWATKPVQCSSLATLIKMLGGRYGEIPYMRLEGFSGMPDNKKVPTQFIISYNGDTTTWTIVEYVNGEQACVLGSGTGGISFPTNVGRTET